MNRKIIALLLLLALAFSIASCGEYVPPVNGGSTSGGQTPPNGNGGETPPPPAGDGDTTFTVSLIKGGSIYIPEDTDSAVTVKWMDGKSVHTATVGADGIATAEGLDGDYSIALDNLPDGYTYDPNRAEYKATNDNPHVEIELLKIITTRGNGNGLYTPDCIAINRTGVYRCEVKKNTASSADGLSKVVYYQFTPKVQGTYSVESMVDISSEMINPIIDIYKGTTGAKYFNERRDGGGASGTYTSNFKYEFTLREDEIGNCYTFAIFAEGKDAVYPINIDFKIEFIEGNNEKLNEADLILPSFIPSFQKIEAGKIVPDEEAFEAWFAEYKAYLESENAKYGNSTYVEASIKMGVSYVFDDDGYKLNPADGYYHVYDEVKYAEYGGWGPILYASITEETKFEPALNTIEYAGNKALTVSEGKENYKLFIEGFDELSISHGGNPPTSGSFFCLCFISKQSSTPCTSYYDAATNPSGCKYCFDGCRHLSTVYLYQKGYADIAINGKVPVTAEMKEFLQKFCVAEKLFADGKGWAETSNPRYDSYEDSQWLFVCGYYE